MLHFKGAIRALQTLLQQVTGQTPLPSPRNRSADHAGFSDELRQQLSGLIKNLPNIVAVLVNRDLRVLFADTAFFAKLGVPFDGLEGKSIEEALPPVLAQPLSKGFLAAWNGSPSVEQIRFDHYMLLAHFVPFYQSGRQQTGSLMVMHNITGLEQTDAALRESQERYRLIAENATDVISAHDTNGTIVYVSPAIENVLGYTPDEVLGSSGWAWIHPDDSALLSAEASAEHEISTVVHRARRKDGSFVWLETTYRLIFDEDGSFQHVVATSRDISQRLQAQLALQQSEEQLRSLIWSMDDLIFSLDLEGRFLVFHQSQNSMYDTPLASEVYVGKHYRDVLPPELTRVLEGAIRVVTTTLETQQRSFSLRMEGKLQHFSLRVAPMISPRLEKLGITCVARDVTDMVLARERQQRLLGLEQLHRMTIARFLESKDIDTAINETLRRAGEFLDVSRAYVVQIRENEMLVDSTHEWCAPGVSSQQAYFQAFAINEIMPSFLPLLGDDGIIDPEHIVELPEDVRQLLESQSIQSLLVLPFNLSGRMQGYIGFDETRRPRRWLPEEIAAVRTIAQSLSRTLEQERAQYDLIQARDTAIRSARLKGEFMSNMSHEIRTPMTGVIGMLELLRETALNLDQAEFVDIAHTSARRLMHLLDDILDFSKIEAGKVTLENIPIDLRSIVSEVHNMFKTPAAKKQVNLYEDIDSAVPARVLGDPTRLRQILTNLVSNAVKFTQHGSIAIRVTSSTSAQGRARLRFEVADTGIGIAESQYEAIFNSFMQADNSTTRRYGGTGLGLAICQQLVALMGGQIDLHSKLDEGSTFGFTLTMTIVALNEPLPAKAMLSHLQALIIDDENTARYVFAQQLRRWGVSVIETTTLEHAQGFLEHGAHQNEEMNLVFLRNSEDKALAWMQEMRQRLGFLAPRFILIAEQSPEETSGFDGVLLRPIRLADLYTVLVNAGLMEETVGASAQDGFITVPQAGRILLAEDDVANWKIVVRAIAHMGYIVDVAHDGQETLELVQENDYALILMDVHMPLIDGLEATRRIRAMHGPKNKIPVVAFTASVLSDELQKYLDVGMNACLAKPYSIEQLRDTVYRWANSSRES